MNTNDKSVSSAIHRKTNDHDELYSTLGACQNVRLTSIAPGSRHRQIIDLLQSLKGAGVREAGLLADAQAMVAENWFSSDVFTYFAGLRINRQIERNRQRRGLKNS